MIRQAFLPVLVLLLLASGLPAYADAPRGVVEAVQRTILSSEISGRVMAMPKRSGEAFSKGDVLVRLGCSLYEAERDKVATRLKQAQRQRDNKERLAELDSVGKLTVDMAALAVEEAEAQRRIARLNVARCRIEAPFKGRVVKRHASEHQSVQAQQKLLEVVGHQLEARIIVPADWLEWLAPGERMTLEVDETGHTVKGEVVRVGAAVDPVSHTVPVWAQLTREGQALRPGMSGAARFEGQPESGEN